MTPQFLRSLERGIRRSLKRVFVHPNPKEVGDIRHLEGNISMPAPLSEDYGKVSVALIKYLSAQQFRGKHLINFLLHPKRVVRLLAWKHRYMMACSYTESRLLCLNSRIETQNFQDRPARNDYELNRDS